MDALLLSLVCCLLNELGGRIQLLGLALSVRFRVFHPLFWGLLAATAANATISATAGSLLAPLLTAQARQLFVAMALIFASLGLLARPRAPDTLSGWRTGPFWTSALGIFILGFSDGSQFLILAFAARSADPAMAAVGGGMGVMLACLPVLLLGANFFTSLPLRLVRLMAGCLFMAVGAGMALSAIGLL